MHDQLATWEKSRPLAGLRVVHHVPLVPNTILKIACLIAAGADVTVTNPFSFMAAHPDAVNCLTLAGIRYVADLNSLHGEQFDLYFDCGAELYQALGKPKIGAIELTGSGDQFYRSQKLDVPVISIDRTFTKQLETVFGCAESSNMAIAQLKEINPIEKSWLIFGFGKIGRGLAYFCVQNKVSVVVVDVCAHQRLLATQLGLEAIDPMNRDELYGAVTEADLIVTATGKKGMMSAYPHEWFERKILANMGIYDEYGSKFTEEAVLNQKKPVNFILNDPTPMKYIDPEFYIHNMAALFLLQTTLAPGVHEPRLGLDEDIIKSWCLYHSFDVDVINKWFIKQAVGAEDKNQQEVDHLNVSGLSY